MSDLNLLVEDSRKLAEQLSHAANDILSFWNSDARCFALVSPQIDKEEHITSTAMCALVLHELGQLPKETARIVKEFLLDRPWTSGTLEENSTYVCGAVITMLSKLGVPYKHPKIQGGLNAICQNAGETGRCYVTGNPPHTFLNYWSIKALKSYWLELSTSHEETYSKISQAAWQELERQLMLEACEHPDFDSDLLTFAVATCSLDPQRIDSKIFAHAIKVFFDHQNRFTGDWPLSHPIFRVPGAERGAVFCSSFELVPAILDIPEQDFSTYRQHIERMLQQLERTKLESRGTKGWSHDREKGGLEPISWITADIYHLLAKYNKILQAEIQRELLTEFKASKQTLHLDDLVVSKETSEHIKNGIVKPCKEFDVLPKEKGVFVILFGPPGSGKTSLARAIATELNWPFIILDVSYFMKEGLDKLFSRTSKLFSRMELLQNVVVLWDEVDELFIAREGEREKIGRMMTEATLSKMQTLHDVAKLLFIIATNNIKNFDEAARRLGRFDKIIPVDLPDFTVRSSQLTKLFQDYGVPVKTWKLDIPQINNRLEGMSVPAIKQLIIHICQEAKGDKDKFQTLLDRKIQIADKMSLTAREQFKDDVEKYARY